MEHDRQRALFADGTKDYRNPMEPNIGDRLTLRFRTARRSAKKVMLCICGQTKRRMLLDGTDEWFDYYTIDFRVEGSFSYYFEIEFDDEEHSVCYYDRGGVWNIARSEYYFRITPGFSTPDWAKGAVMYQIYVDRFCNGDATNDVLDGEYFYIGAPVQHVDDWYRNPQAMDVRDFYGGDLQGVWKKLDYLQDLGIEVIYFNPLFVSPSNHKFRILRVYIFHTRLYHYNQSGFEDEHCHLQHDQPYKLLIRNADKSLLSPKLIALNFLLVQLRHL